jgi:hypothetical protein
MMDYLGTMLFIGFMFWPWLFAGAAIGGVVVGGIVLAASSMRQTRPKVLNESPRKEAP